MTYQENNGQFRYQPPHSDTPPQTEQPAHSDTPSEAANKWYMLAFGVGVVIIIVRIIKLILGW